MAFFLITFAMAFVDMHIFSRDFLHFDMSLLLSTFTLRGYLISIAYCLFFHLAKKTMVFFRRIFTIFELGILVSNWE